MSAPKPPALVFAFEARIEVGAPVELGKVPRGDRRIIPITGGTFEGPGLKGKVLAQGADWQIVRADGTAEIDARYTLQTDQGAFIYIDNQGMRHGPPEVMARLRAGEPVAPSEYYFRTSPRFEVSAPELQWLTKAIFVCDAERLGSAVIVRFWRLE